MNADILLSIESQWKSYRERVIHPHAIPDQLYQLRMAFFGGFAASHGITKAIGEPEISEEMAMEILTNLDMELHRFIELLNPCKK